MRRDELYDSDSSDPGSGSHHVDAQEDAEVRAKLNERLASLLGLDLSTSAPTFEHKESDRGEHAHDERDDSKPDEEEFEFRLFSTSSKTAAPAKVILAASDDEDAPQGEGAFTVPVRPTSYYMAGDPTPEQRERYRWAAVAGEDIVLGARKRAWGLERPWRVIRLTVPNKSLAGLPTIARGTLAYASEGGEQETAVKRKRPGKKRRIATRIKAKAEKEKREAEEKHKMSKEEHLKEKKKRLNREKKLKRRAKEREKKLATKGEGGSQPDSEAGASASESDDGSAA